MRILQMDATATVPLLPPTAVLAGDRVVSLLSSSEEPSPLGGSAEEGDEKTLEQGSSRVASQVEGRVGIGTSSEALSTPSLPLPKGRESAVLTFTASGPNAPGVVTELMVQRLVNVRRTPTTQYKSAAFVAFDTAHLTADVPVGAGIYAHAYRFVEKATGRTTGLQTLGVVTTSS